MQPVKKVYLIFCIGSSKKMKISIYIIVLCKQRKIKKTLVSQLAHLILDLSQIEKFVVKIIEVKQMPPIFFISEIINTLKKKIFLCTIK